MARPTITGQIIRRIELHCGHDGYNKDYRITVTQEDDGQCRVFYEHGPSGRLQQGGEKTKQGSVAKSEAMALADELAESKRNGRSRYDKVSDQSFAPKTSGAATSKPDGRRPRKEATRTFAALPAESRQLLRRAF